VNFAYINDEYVLKNISFKINGGEKVAFVGATGAVRLDNEPYLPFL
jgi:ABC-type multidrug transport system fused ATPase/permease subunit